MSYAHRQPRYLNLSYGAHDAAPVQSHAIRLAGVQPHQLLGWFIVGLAILAWFLIGSTP
jgi:hypothetical protein